MFLRNMRIPASSLLFAFCIHQSFLSDKVDALIVVSRQSKSFIPGRCLFGFHCMHTTNHMLFSSLQHTTGFDDDTSSKDTRDGLHSLAGPYLVKIASKNHSHPDETIWSLIPIDHVIKDNTAEAVGAKAIAALESFESKRLDNDDCSASYVLKGTYNDKKNSIQVVATQQPQHQDEKDDELLSVLAPIIAQLVVSTDDLDIPQDLPLSVKLLGQDPISVGSLSSPADVLELYAAINSGVSSNMEIVEMVGQNSNGIVEILGMVPRPLLHTHNLLHRGIGMVITKDKPFHVSETHFPDLYCHRRTDTKRIFPSLYDMFVGGVSTAGEDASITASREVAEELGLVRALTDDTPLSLPLFDCTVCTSYNRCVVTVFSYTMDTSQESVSWQEEEVAWGDFVSYPIVQAAAELSIQRLVAANQWPGSKHFATEPDTNLPINTATLLDWKTWDFVPDGLLVWKAWLQWIEDSQQ